MRLEPEMLQGQESPSLLELVSYCYNLLPISDIQLQFLMFGLLVLLLLLSHSFLYLIFSFLIGLFILSHSILNCLAFLLILAGAQSQECAWSLRGCFGLGLFNVAGVGRLLVILRCGLNALCIKICTLAFWGPGWITVLSWSIPPKPHAFIYELMEGDYIVSITFLTCQQRT